ncbi:MULTISPECIES: magnesium/cobalt transporter CorA [Massilia]|uniref:Magnesium transport protein CorA n=2 Tax=Massilia TaxID=149698 RepID=A0A422QLD3_9BURK|nr:MULTISPECIES: magnesium/cobalt transporter CorA [Massilia]MDY0962737.1 magnesium/cobalt transporter CorA [Massilia sp. CFBP9026]RNF30810.1 magnesium transporter [Massilia aurea]TXF97768.1 magnesium/cobalt transporter CorA [Massilia arenae]
MLINCVAYQEGKKLCDIPVEDISEYLKQDDTFVWVALRDPAPTDITLMQEEFGLHELAVEDALRGHQRPKLEEYGDSLFVVVQIVELAGDELNVGQLAVFAGENYVLSVRRDANQGFLGVRARAEREPHQLKKGAGFVLYALVDAVVDRYFPVVDMLESELESIEDHIFGMQGKQRANVERLYELKRKAQTLRHAVVPLMDAVGRLYGGRVPGVVVETQDYFRDVHDHLYRIAGRLDAVRDTINTAIQVTLSMVAIEENEVSKKLASYAAIFAVFTAFAGVWGMNFEFMPELKWKWGYPLALLTMVGVCAYLYRRFKKAGWL